MPTAAVPSSSSWQQQQQQQQRMGSAASASPSITSVGLFHSLVIATASPAAKEESEFVARHHRDDSSSPNRSHHYHHHHQQLLSTFRDHVTIVFCDAVSDTDSDDDYGEGERTRPTSRDGFEDFDEEHYIRHGRRYINVHGEEGTASEKNLLLIAGLNASTQPLCSSHGCDTPSVRRRGRSSPLLLETEIVIATRPLEDEAEGSERRGWGDGHHHHHHHRGGGYKYSHVYSASNSNSLLSIRVTEVKGIGGGGGGEGVSQSEEEAVAPPSSSRRGGTMRGESSKRVEQRVRILFSAQGIPLPMADAAVSSFDFLMSCVQDLAPYLYVPEGNNNTIGAGGTLHCFLPQGACQCLANNSVTAAPKVGPNARGRQPHQLLSPPKRIFSNESVLGRIGTAGLVCDDEVDEGRLTDCGFTPQRLLEQRTSSPSLRHAAAASTKSRYGTWGSPRDMPHVRRHLCFASPSSSYFIADGREPLAVEVCDGSREVINAIVLEAMELVQVNTA